MLQCDGFLRWFARANPHAGQTTYLTDSDLEEPDVLAGVEVLIVIGRSEYWTRGMREAFDSFVDRGGRALLLCSELMYWQVRVDKARHRLCRYKRDLHPDPLHRTVRWHDPSLEYPVYPRTGCELWYGGFDAVDEGIGWGGPRVTCSDSPLIAGCGLEADDILQLPDAEVWDGAPVERGGDGSPRVDFGEAPPLHHEVIGYNLTKPMKDELPPGEPATGLWMALRRDVGSGTVVHCGTFGWCGRRGLGGEGPDSARAQKVVLRMLEVLLNDDWPFSYAQNARSWGHRRSDRA